MRYWTHRGDWTVGSDLLTPVNFATDISPSSIPSKLNRFLRENRDQRQAMYEMNEICRKPVHLKKVGDIADAIAGIADRLSPHVLREAFAAYPPLQPLRWNKLLWHTNRKYMHKIHLSELHLPGHSYLVLPLRFPEGAQVSPWLRHYARSQGVALLNCWNPPLRC